MAVQGPPANHPRTLGCTIPLLSRAIATIFVCRSVIDSALASRRLRQQRCAGEVGRRQVKHQVLRLLRENARLSDAQIARRLGIEPAEVTSIIRDLEKSRVIVGYQAVMNPNALEDAMVEAVIEVKVTPHGTHGFDSVAQRVCAFPEVQSLYLSSGESDFMILVEGRSLNDVSAFLMDKLTPIKEIVGTTTHFVLKEYKKDGVMLAQDFENDRLPVTP